VLLRTQEATHNHSLGKGRAAAATHQKIISNFYEFATQYCRQHTQLLDRKHAMMLTIKDDTLGSCDSLRGTSIYQAVQRAVVPLLHM
jgi:hypothetical protein